jgi:hypothetical protein
VFQFADTHHVVIDPIPENDECDKAPLHHGVLPMVQHFIDHTLPAHDPNFPKPRGLIPVPPKVAEWVAEEESRFEREHGSRFTPVAQQRILDDWTLNYYYDDAYIAYRRTPQGVEVLAVGLEEARQYMKDHPLETRRDVLIGVV